MLPTTTLQLRSPEAFRAAMTKAEVTTRSLAARAGCSRSRIGQLMLDRDASIASGSSAGISVGTAAAIAAALDVDVSDLFEFPDGPELIRLGLIRLA